MPSREASQNTPSQVHAPPCYRGRYISPSLPIKPRRMQTKSTITTRCTSKEFFRKEPPNHCPPSKRENRKATILVCRGRIAWRGDRSGGGLGGHNRSSLVSVSARSFSISCFWLLSASSSCFISCGGVDACIIQESSYHKPRGSTVRLFVCF